MFVTIKLHFLTGVFIHFIIGVDIERHNERKNEDYTNIDVVLEQSENNVYFKRCENTYLHTFDGMIEHGEISTRGFKEDAHIMGEMIFDVNLT